MNSARDLINEADSIRSGLGLTQAGWSRLAGLDDVGMNISRAYNRGNCKLSMLVQLVAPLGYELRLVKREDMP